MTAEQVHEELTKKAHQQYKDIAVVCNFMIYSFIYSDLEFKITFTTTGLPSAFLTGLQDHG